jgi:hypothetical protein
MSLQQGTYTLVAVGEQYVSHVGTVCAEMKRCLAVALVKRGGGEKYIKDFVVYTDKKYRQGWQHVQYIG